MKKFQFGIFAAFIIVGAMSCKNKEGDFLRKGSGDQAKIGDIVTFNFTVKKDTATVFSSATQGQPAQEILNDPKAIPDAFYAFLTRDLLTMRKGDSAVFIMKIDTMKVKPRGLETAKMMQLNIGVNDVKSEKDFLATLPPDQQKQFMAQKKSVAIQERLAGKKPEIEAIGKGLVADSATFRGRAKLVGDSTIAAAALFAAGKLPANVQTTASGLKIEILKEGTGKLPADNDLTFVHYYGCTKAGKKFDESFTKGQPFAFPVGIGQVIPAWDEAVKLIKEGSSAIIFVPSALGYGERGAGASIGPNTDLVFYIEVLKTI